MAVTLPLVLLLLDYYLKRKPFKTALLDKIPYFILSLIMGLIAIMVVFSSFGAGSRPEKAFSTIFIPAQNIVFYIGKTFLPIKLSCLYPHYYFQFNAGHLFSLIAVLVLCLTAVWSLKYSKKLFFGLALFLASLLPALQFIPNSIVIAADRYTYFPSIGIAFIIASFFYWLYYSKLKHFISKSLLVLLLACITVSLSFLTFERCKVWSDSIVLWSDVLKNSDVPFAYFNRGEAYSFRQQYAQAITDYKKALFLYNSKYTLKRDYSGVDKKIEALGSDYSAVYNFLGILFENIGHREEAKHLFFCSLSLNPRNVEPYNNIAVLLGNLGGYDEAIEVSRKALEIDPRSGKACYNLAMAYYFKKEYGLSSEYMQRAIDLGYAIPVSSLGLMKLIKSKEEGKR